MRKRDFELIANRVDNFLDAEKVGSQDEIVFSYERKTYTTISKLLVITK